MQLRYRLWMVLLIVTLALTWGTGTTRAGGGPVVRMVNMVRPLGEEEQAAYGMDEPNAVVTLETGDKTITLRVGAKDPDKNSYVVTSSESPYYVRVSGYSLNNLVENTRDDFLQEPPTPTPEATSAP